MDCELMSVEPSRVGLITKIASGYTSVQGLDQKRGYRYSIDKWVSGKFEFYRI